MSEKTWAQRYLLMGWGCHTCGRVDRALFLWLARRRSIQHERKDHGFSVYDSNGGSR